MIYLLRFFDDKYGMLRVIVDNGKCMFCGADVAAALGYKDTKKAVKYYCLPDDCRFYLVKDTHGQKHKTRFVTMGDMFRMLDHCKLPETRTYRIWFMMEVMSELLNYMGPPSPGQILDDSVSRLLHQKQDGTLDMNDPAVQKLLKSQNDLFLRVGAKEIGVPAEDFLHFLRDQHYVVSTKEGVTLPLMNFWTKVLLEMRNIMINGYPVFYTVVTPRGVEYFRWLMKSGNAKKAGR